MACNIENEIVIETQKEETEKDEVNEIRRRETWSHRRRRWNIDDFLDELHTLSDFYILSDTLWNERINRENLEEIMNITIKYCSFYMNKNHHSRQGLKLFHFSFLKGVFLENDPKKNKINKNN